MAIQECDLCGIYKDMAPADVPRGMPDEYTKELADAEELAAAENVFDEGRPDLSDSIIELNASQEMDLYCAASSLSKLAAETNSSVSELMKMAGF